MTPRGRLLLLDKSAVVRGGLPQGDELCVCSVTRLEVLFSARSPVEYAAREEDLTEFRDLRMDVHTFAIAEGAQRELARSGQQRVPMPDVLIAACAQQHGAGVLHVDRHYDTLAGVLAFEPVRLG